MSRTASESEITVFVLWPLFPFFCLDETSSQELRHPPGSQKPAPVVSEPRADIPGCSGAKVVVVVNGHLGDVGNLGTSSYPALASVACHVVARQVKIPPESIGRHLFHLCFYP